MQRNLSAGSKQLVQVLIGSAVAILLVGAALVGLMNAQMVKLQIKADNKQAEVGSSEQVTRRYQLTLDAYNDTMSQIKYLEASVTPQSYVPTLLQQLQTLAQTTKLKVLAVRPAQIIVVAPPVQRPSDSGSGSSDSSSSSSSSSTAPAAAPAKKKAPPPYDTLGVTLSVSGTYRQTLAFLYDLTQFPKIVALSGVEMHPSAPGPGDDPLASPIMASTINLTAFVFHDTDAPVAIPGVSTSTAPAGTAPVTTASAEDPHPLPPPPSEQGRGFGQPAVASAGDLAGAAQRAVAGATGVSRATRERTDLGIGTL